MKSPALALALVALGGCFQSVVTEGRDEARDGGGGVADGGLDAGRDAGRDAGFDAGRPDLGLPDVGFDLGLDLGPPDTGVDLGVPPPPPELRAPAFGTLTGSLHAPADGLNAPLRPWLLWAPVAEAERYRVQLAACPGGPWEDCSFASPEVDVQVRGAAARAGDALRFRPAEPLPVATTPPVGRRYVWRVASCDTVGCGDFSPSRYLFVGRDRHDLDGDGYGELVVAAQGSSDDVPEYPGRVLVYRGGPMGPAASPEWTLETPNPVGLGAFGAFMAALGDMDGDGFGDLAIAAPAEVSGGLPTGRAYVFRGGAMGPVSTPIVLDAPRRGLFASFGRPAALGDLNGDGFADLAIANAPDEVYVYLGGEVVPTMPDASLRPPALDAPILTASFAQVVAGPGDVDGDGYPELLVAASRESGRGGVGLLYPGGAGAVASMPRWAADESVVPTDR
ncbi:MAG: VCBS repeat-containing protein, partial [Myxococcota bacterium]